jgi:hypothetical protein
MYTSKRVKFGLALGALVTCVFGAFANTATQDEQLLGVEISGGSRRSLYLPASTEADMVQLFAVIPVAEGGFTPGEKEPIAAIEVVPRMQGAVVKVDIFTVFGEVGRVRNCDELKRMRLRHVASHIVRKGEAFELPREFSEVGARSVNPVTVKAVAKRDDHDGKVGTAGSDGQLLRAFYSAPARAGSIGQADCPCASCGNTLCCPAKGRCLGCGDCGTVCCKPIQPHPGPELIQP